MVIATLPFETIAEPELIAMEEIAAQCFSCTPRRLPPVPLPADSYDDARSQHHATVLLRAALAACPPDTARLLAVTRRDIFIPMLTFVFGQAQVDGPVALISLARLRQDFYGLPPRPDLLRSRVRKEAAHELGHTFGLYHCSDKRCAMALSINVADIDTKRAELCRTCAARLSDRIAELRQTTRADEE